MAVRGGMVTTLTEAQILVERWRWEYNHVRPGLPPACPGDARDQTSPPHPLG